MKRYVNASLSKRLGAFILDVCLVVLGATLVCLACLNLFSKSTLMLEANDVINNIQVDSHLYVYSEDNPLITVLVDEEEYDDAIKSYYLDYKKDEATYNKKMEESELFVLKDGFYQEKSTVSEEAVLEFYQKMMGEAILEIKQNEDYERCTNIIINCELYCVVISILASYLVFIVFVPFLMKKRNTIGQRVLNLALVHSDTYEVPSRTQIAFRAFIILIIEVYLATYCYGVTALISTGFIVFRKDKSSFHDLLSQTRMIDYHYVELDDNLKDYEEKNEKQK